MRFITSNILYAAVFPAAKAETQGAAWPSDLCSQQTDFNKTNDWSMANILITVLKSKGNMPPKTMKLRISFMPLI
jgi:hypothetical protein